MIPNFYAYTPVEVKMQVDALIIQDKLVEIITNNTLIWGGFIALSIGIALLIQLKNIVLFENPARAIYDFILRFFVIAIFLTVLTSRDSRTPNIQTYNGKNWNSKVNVNGSGIPMYRYIYGAFSEISKYLSSQLERVSPAYKDYMISPEGTFRILKQMSEQQFDDPKILDAFKKLDSNCLKSETEGVVVDISTGLLAFYKDEDGCKEIKLQLTRDIDNWAQKKASIFDIILTTYDNCVGISTILAGNCSYEGIKNGLTIFAARNYAQTEAIFGLNVKGDALFNDIANRSLLPSKNTNLGILSNATAYTSARAMWLDRLFSMRTLLNLIFTQESYKLSEMKDFRNHASETYNKYLTFLPYIRGWGQALLAYSFLIVCLIGCVGNIRPFISWVGTCFVFSMYLPLQSLLYVTARSFIDFPAFVMSEATDKTMIGVGQYMLTEVAGVQFGYAVASGMLAVMSLGFFAGLYRKAFEFQPHFTDRALQKIGSIVSSVTATGRAIQSIETIKKTRIQNTKRGRETT